LVAVFTAVGVSTLAWITAVVVSVGATEVAVEATANLKRL
jgi:hypothetical protein